MSMYHRGPISSLKEGWALEDQTEKLLQFFNFKFFEDHIVCG